MRLFAIAALAAFPFVPATASGQHWTPEEQEIIDLNQSCWDAWGNEDFAAARRTCNEHPDGRHWWTAESAPGIGWFEKNADRWAAAFHPIEDRLYWEVRPLSVRIFGDVALIHFWGTVTTIDDQGVRTTVARKQLNIWQRVDGRWTWIGGMASPETN